MKAQLFTPIEKVINTLDPTSIPDARKTVLQPFIDFIQSKVSAHQNIRLNFICTHNSRRSHLSQVWAQTLAHHFNIKNVACYSGGTESTAVFPIIVETLEKSGFEIEMLSQSNNPIYSIKFAENELPIIGFSKKMDAAFNPTSHFAAIMTCSQADGDCPIVAGAEGRFPIPFEDPKTFDNTPQQGQKYMERSLQIATELCYTFSKIEC